MPYIWKIRRFVMNLSLRIPDTKDYNHPIVKRVTEDTPPGPENSRNNYK